MVSIVNGVWKGTSFLFALLWAPGSDDMTMWWLSACRCHFSHDFLMLFSHGSRSQNDKQMPNAFMDVIFLRAHALCFILRLPSSTLPSCLLIPLYFKPHPSLPFLSSFPFLSLFLSFSSCRCCAWSRLRWLWSSLHSRTPPLPLLHWQSSSLPTSLWWCFLYPRCSDLFLTPKETAAHAEGCTGGEIKGQMWPAWCL